MSLVMQELLANVLMLIQMTLNKHFCIFVFVFCLELALLVDIEFIMIKHFYIHRK